MRTRKTGVSTPLGAPRQSGADSFLRRLGEKQTSSGSRRLSPTFTPVALQLHLFLSSWKHRSNHLLLHESLYIDSFMNDPIALVQNDQYDMRHIEGLNWGKWT